MEETDNNKSSGDTMETSVQLKHPKRIKTQQQTSDSAGGGEDRISLLPDCLIIEEILSRLDYTKDAIRTGTLSKRWQHLWTLVPNLTFIHHNQPPLDFYLSVNTTLTHHQLNKLNKFHLSATYDNRFEFQVNNWIRYITNHEVQDLFLSLWNMNDDEDEFVLKDGSFFNNSHFTHLHLGECVYDPTGPISWANLTSLSISNGKLSHDLIANILSGSPLLDTLRLDCCYGYSRLDITSKSVKHLEFSGYTAQEDEYDDLDDIIEINAPYISSLTIIDSLMLAKLLLLEVSSLVKVSLNYTKCGYYEKSSKEEEEEMLKRFILHLRHAKEVKIGKFCVKALTRLTAKGFIFPPNLQILDAASPLYSDSDSMELVDGCDNDSSHNESSDNDSSHNESSDNGSSDSDASNSDSDESRDSEELVFDDGPEADEVN
uniref:F-box protein At5g03100-like n=1 Tax=Erigeron canadensis TaxID=72917 RepID=UPI001CB97DE9|nr:F-box protein At5g03100-like [Erigeron canadensis]